MIGFRPLPVRSQSGDTHIWFELAFKANNVKSISRDCDLFEIHQANALTHTHLHHVGIRFLRQRMQIRRDRRFLNDVRHLQYRGHLVHRFGIGRGVRPDNS